MAASEETPAGAVASSRVGQVLKGKWQLDRLLGVGGMASVYVATHRNGSRVAVKMLHPEISQDPGIRSRFLREGYVANKVGHRGSVAVLDDDVTDDGAVFLVMELLEGETLDGRATRCGGKLEPAEVLWITDQLLDVLAAAHEKGIIHRDIKPENVFIRTDGVVKVLDFGIARMKELSTGSSATRTGSLMGTPAYMPPEQARGRWELVDGRTDLWAVGATMFTLLTGQLVHQARTVNEQLLSAMTQQAPSIGTLRPGLPASVIEVVDKALAFNTADRWADARQMQSAVRTAYQVLAGSPIATAPKLAVPDMPFANTMASSPELQARPGQVTGDAVVAGQTGVDSRTARAGGRLALILGMGGAAAVALAMAIGVAVVLSRSGSTAPALASSELESKPAPEASGVAVNPAPPTASVQASTSASQPPPPTSASQPATTTPAATTPATPRTTPPKSTAAPPAAKAPPDKDLMDIRR